MRINFSSLFFLLALAGCTAANLEAEKIKVDNPLKPARSTDFKEFTAVIEPEAYTKSTLDEQSLKVAWEYTDEILVVDSKGHKAIYSPKKEDGKALAATATLCRVSGDTLLTREQDPDVTYKAYYPSSLLENGLPGVEVFTNPGVFGPVPMIAEGVEELNFSFLCTTLRLEYAADTKMIVTKFVLTADSPLSGPGNISFSPVGISLTGEAASNGIVFDYDSPYTYKKSMIKSFNVFVPEGAYTNMKAEIVYFNNTDTDTVTRVKQIALNYKVKTERGKQCVIDLNNPDGKEINLNRYGTANCYPISAGEEFYFTPTKGCSDEAVGDIDSVGVIWAMDNTDIEPAEDWFISNLYYDTAENLIRFSIPEGFYHPGNVLVGAYDAAGALLWSWHIWILGDGITDLVFDNVNNIYAMDRYLGQLSGKYPDTYSPYVSGSIVYQWGRKDPMPGYTTYLGSKEKRTMVVVQGKALTQAKGPATVEESIANPTVFYTSTGNWADQDSLWTPEKTIYDPCPAGYRVLDRAIIESQPTWEIVNNINVGKSQFYYNKNYSKYLFPFTSYYKGSSFSFDEKAGATYLWTMEQTSTQATYFYISGSKISTEPIKQFSKSTACGVRCQKMPVVEE